MTNTLPAATVAELVSMGAVKTDMWAAVREQRIADSLDVSARLDEMREAFRRKHFPRAREVVVVCDRAIGQPLSVFRRTPSGRAVLVYEEGR